jgi:hypothetical protein
VSLRSSAIEARLQGYDDRFPSLPHGSWALKGSDRYLELAPERVTECPQRRGGNVRISVRHLDGVDALPEHTEATPQRSASLADIVEIFPADAPDAVEARAGGNAATTSRTV